MTEIVLFPEPQKMELQEGAFRIYESTIITLDDSCSINDFEAAKLLKDEVYSMFRLNMKINKGFFKENISNTIFVKRDDALNRECYKISITSKSIVINALESAGVLYAFQTLRQLVRVYGLNLQCLTIDDYPGMKNRGFYQDVTRGKVPTLRNLKELIDIAAFYKLNQFQLYIEHSFAFDGFSEIWAGYDPLTAEEILELDQYCKIRNIELIPSIATFGHLNDVLSSQTFGALSEVDGKENSQSIWLDRMRHHTLDVSNPESIEFVKKMIDMFLPLFSSNKFNICCDETVDLAVCKSKELEEKYGKGKLYVDFVNKIINHVKKFNKRIMMWNDILLKYSDSICDIPKDTILLSWDYSPDPVEENIKTISRFGLEQYVCPSAGGYYSFVCRQKEKFTNIKKMIDYGYKNGVVGVLNTHWGDSGHICPVSNVIPGLIFGAGLSWNYKDDYNEFEDFVSFERAISKIEYGDKTQALLSIIAKATEVSITDWVWLTFLYYDIKGWLDEGDKKYAYFDDRIKEFFIDSDYRLYNSEYYKISKLADQVLDLASSVYEAKKMDLYEHNISLRGYALSCILIIQIKKFIFNQEIDNVIFTSLQLAEKFELWLDEYMSVWRRKNKESELFRIRDVIKGWCRILRSF